MIKDNIDLFVNDVKSSGLDVSYDVQGSSLSTYRIGGALRYVVGLNNKTDINTLSNIIKSNYVGTLDPSRLITIGKGSNILVSDEGFDGCVFMFDSELANIIDVANDGDNFFIEAGAGCSLGSFARQCATLGAGGLMFYVGIPGSVGGAVAMNAGGHGSQTSDVLETCETLNLSTGSFNSYTVSECKFSYRLSRFSSTDLIYSASFHGTRQEPETLKKEIDEIVSWRRDNQPGGRNVGSVFQNPKGFSSGKLIEECSLKGFRIGTAFVSDKHANFIQADPDAKACDVRDLIVHVQKTVFDRTGIMLDTEVRFVGNYGS